MGNDMVITYLSAIILVWYLCESGRKVAYMQELL